MSCLLRTVPLLITALLLVRAHAVRANELDQLFSDSVVFTNIGYTGGSNLISNFPLRVDISAVRPHGFDYDLAGVDASRIRFNYHREYIDASTNVVTDTVVHFAVTNWNTEGTSTLYVAVPYFNNSLKAKLTMYWNPEVPDDRLPANYPGHVPPAVHDANRSKLWNDTLDAQTNAHFLGCGPAYRRGINGVKLLNYWLVAPRLSSVRWKQGEKAAEVDSGLPVSPNPVTTVVYYDRSDNSLVGTVMPVMPGAYSAVVTVAESDTYAELSKRLDFAIESGSSVDGIATTNDFANTAVFSWLKFDSKYAAEPFLVRLAENSPPGFSYGALRFGSDAESVYSDVRFYNEKGVALDYEIFTWTSGESYVWVKVGNQTKDTRVTMCWNQGSGTKLPANDPSVVLAGKTPTAVTNLWDQLKANYTTKVGMSAVSDDPSKQLKNRWKVEPSLSVTQWRPGDDPAVVTVGISYSGAAKVTYTDRSTGEVISEMPTSQVGEYRATFRCDETPGWSELEKSIDFRIVKELNSHDLGDTSTRALLANGDCSVSGGEVFGQSYDDNEDGWGLPFWTHHERGSDTDVSDFDYTRLFSSYNLFAGTHHEYISVTGGSTTNRIWGLENVRFGNLFNNGRLHPGEQGATGLRSNQNYLPWNPRSDRMLAYEGSEVGEYHRYAGTFLLQNVLDDRLHRYAQICSPCYEEGIGTIYFDIVNAFADNVYDKDGNAQYAITVEVATNVVDYVETPPVDGPYPNGIWAVDDTDHTLLNAYAYADWFPVAIKPIRFFSDTGDEQNDCEALPATTNFELTVENGGSFRNFYRVYVPLDIDCPARFRIRRTRIDRSNSLNPDADAFIIVDNLICSKARDKVRLEPYGHFDAEMNGKQYLGQAAAFDPAFPSPRNAITARVKALDRSGAEVPAGRVTAVTMHYRWHYLEQRQSEWQRMDFDPSSLESLAPLVLPGALGDIEFWFEGSQNFGYYTYANYSGTKLGVPGYSEAFVLVTNGWNGTTADWDIRIREGVSDYESAVMIVRNPEGDSEEIQMELVDGHLWRGYYQTLEEIEDGVDVRFELRNRQESGSKIWSWNTNYLYCAEKEAKLSELPHHGKVSNGSTGTWTRVAVDATTGYLMFQVNDESHGFSVVRADYQNFNKWTDAQGSLFVGSAADESGLPASGVSPVTRDFVVRYDKTSSSYQPSVPTNAQWNLDFESRKDYTYYKTFASDTEKVSRWTLGKGQFVYGCYRMPTSGTALQMAGRGEGYAQFSDNALGLWPRGVESVRFNARLAQTTDFTDMTLYDVSRLTNTAFMAYAAFDNDSNLSFTGNASLSLAAYCSGEGGYEARWEQIKGKLDAKKTSWEPEKKGQRLALYRWNERKSGGYEQTLLCAVTNDVTFNFDMPSSTKSDRSQATYMPMSIAAYQVAGSEDTMIVVGVGRAGVIPKNLPGNYWCYLAYRDNSSSKLVRGAYGIMSANSPGLFVRPRYASVTNTVTVKWGGLTMPAAGRSNYRTGNNAYPALPFVSCRSELAYWKRVPGRSEIFNDSDTCYGFKAADVWQTLDLWASSTSGGESYSEKIASFTLSNHWGRVMASEEFGATLPLVWRTRDAKLKLRTGGNLDEQSSPSVIVDNIQVRQWRGKNEIVLYSSGDSPDNAADCREVSAAGDPDNFIYTSGWVNDYRSGNAAIEFSAKRTIPGRPAGVRTPLMDGLSGSSGNKRGSGLGNLTIAYQKAQTNVVLLVQVATNVTAGDLVNRSVAVTGELWRTVCRLDYDTLGSSGKTNIVIGVRNGDRDGFGTVARVILDPELVASVATNSVPSAFGSIEFTYVACQDEPPIDAGCWWGWNLRTLGDFVDSEHRMYLPDPSLRPSPGLSMALNNSVKDDIVEEKSAEYRRHMPFLQTPVFKDNVVGQVSFKARKYTYSDRDQAAEIALYGITAEGFKQGEWTLLTRFAVSNAVFNTYTYRVNSDSRYCAFRFGVTGVSGVDPAERGPKPLYGNEPVRVLLDEVIVSEAVTPQLAFRGVGAFRSDMSGDGMIIGVGSEMVYKSEQPLAGECWGVQCELYAVMLEEEIDLTNPPKVKLYWYEGSDIWGFDNWKNSADHHEAWLGRAADTSSMVYRSSYITAPEAVIPQSVKEPGDYAPVVQYMLEAYYTTIDPKTGVKSMKTRLLKLEDKEWTVPEWYAPVDYNQDKRFGAGKDLACFCILDDLAPGWAWINEINIYGPSELVDNADGNCQFVEIAAPREYDMNGWRIEMIESREYCRDVITNVAAVFGRALPRTKNVNVTSNYVFHVIANENLHKGDRSILEREGALDGYWQFQYPGFVFYDDGVIDWSSCIGVRLVRPNGIVEHELVALGQALKDASSYEKPENVVKYLNSKMQPQRFFFVGEDSVEGDNSLSVVTGQGGNALCWKNNCERTPGEINKGQQINPDYPVPQGEMMPVFIDLDQTGGKIEQSLDGVNFTNASMRVFLRNGSTIGTNVVYRVDSWYEVAEAVQENALGVRYLDVSNNFDRVNRKVAVTIAQNCSNRVTVTAKAGPDYQLRKYGCDDQNPYTPAVLDWLQRGTDLHGNEFAKTDGIIRPAEFWGLSGYEGPLSLTVMYWLDIDPTVGDMVFQAGMSSPPQEKKVKYHDNWVSNVTMSVFMMITNKTTDVTSKYYGKAWSPYVIRGITPGDCSTNYTAGSGNVWTGATFKISGILPNGHTSESVRDNWVDLRWFTFAKDSFYQESDEPAHPRFTTDIEIRDPINRKDSPGYSAGWYDWVREHPEQASIRPFFKWHLDTRLRPFEVEILRTNNFYTVTSP